MTFFDVSMKMLFASFRRYRLYFLCNVFSIVLFYSFAAIFTNRTFMDPAIVDSMISSNIYAPSLFVGTFLAVFLPYSYHAFMRNRKQEYGIFITLGMSETGVLANMLLENCVIAGLSLISGLLLGTGVSYVFYFIIQKVIGVSGVQWYFNISSYLWTAALYGAAMLLTLAAGVLGLMKMKIDDLLKERFRAEKIRKSRPAVLLGGIAFVIGSILIILWDYESDSAYRLPLSIGLMFAGTCMIIMQAESAEQYFAKRFPDFIRRHILEISFIRQHDRSRRRVGIIAAWLMGFSIFFAGLCLVIYPGQIENANRYSPYDMVYSRIFGKNQAADGEIESLLNRNGVTVKTVKHVEYLRDRSFNLLPVSEVNKEFKCDYNVAEGKFLTVFQVDLKDGYGHEMSSPESVQFKCGNESLNLLSASADVRILFNRNPTFADRTLILSDNDYRKIASGCDQVWKGTMNLYSFADWKDSGKGVDAVQRYLSEKNQVRPSEEHYYKASSRFEAYTTARQSAEFLIFIMFFVVVLFYAASNIMIHFKVRAESEEEERMLSGLSRIGATSEEMLGMIRHKNLYYYLPQVVLGLFIGVLYNYKMNEFYGLGGKAAGYSLLVGISLLAIQFIGVIKYSRRELFSFDIQ